MAQVKVKMVAERDTKGALVFCEIDKNGTKIDIKDRAKGGMDQGLINTLYLRKCMVEGAPKEITVTVDF